VLKFKKLTKVQFAQYSLFWNFFPIFGKLSIFKNASQKMEMTEYELSHTVVLAACAVNKISERITHSNAQIHS
jgi:hypothetical protein